MTDCDNCYQSIIQTPRQCFTCGKSIQHGQSYRYRQARAGCEPVHAECFEGAPTRVTTDQSKEGRLL